MSDSDRDQEIEEITRELQRLTVKLEKLCEEKRAARRTKAKKVKRREIRIGDYAEIMNTYQGLKGTIGIVKKCNTSFVTIETDDGRCIVRGIQNIRIIED